MKTRRNKSDAAIALVLALTIASTLLTFAPVTFGQEVKIRMSATMDVLPDPVGLGQSVTILGMIYPVLDAPYPDLTFNITKPDATTETIVHDSNEIGEYDFNYVCDQLGTWRVELSWAGDETHQSVSRSTTWTVQTEQVPPQGKVTTYAGVATVPQVVGLGQPVYIIGFIVPPREISGALYADLTFTITKPDDSTITEVSYSNSEASHSFTVVCDQTGTWSVQLSYPGWVFQEAATSPITTWTVQTDPVPGYPAVPLPTDYWWYPVSSNNWDWYQLTGAWPQDNFDRSDSNWNPYTTAPAAPHIIWRLQTSEAGLIGGEYGAYATNPMGPGPSVAIEGKTSGLVAAHGRIYYTTTDVDESNVPHFVLHCHDQYTGEVIYERYLPLDPAYPIGRTSRASLYLEIGHHVKVDPKIGVSISGAFSLWVVGGSTWEVDPWSGSPYFFWPGRAGNYHDGAMYFTNYNGTTDARESGTTTKWDTRTKSTVWTAKIPSISKYWEDILMRDESPSSGIPYGYRITTWNATTGDLIAAGPEYDFTSSDTSSIGYGKFFVHCADRRVRALSLYTGQLEWTSEQMDYPWGVWASYGASCGDGLVFFDSHDGHEYAYDVETGDLKWKAYTEDTSETAMGTYGTWSQVIIAAGKVYFACGEHNPPNPNPRGGKLRCVNIENGEELWAITGFYAKAGVQNYGGVSSGILWYPSLYDGCIYFFGKGKTATTVSASPKVMAKGGSVMIEGTVTDQSPGAKDTPAISDADMAEWMEYLYTGRPMPTDATGVPVMLQACLENGTVIDIGWATSDIMGHYEYAWTPPAEGTYKILATFCGSDSYWMSSTQTALEVEAAPTAPTEPEEEPAYTTIDLAIIAAVVVAIIIGIVNLWALRKRK